MLRVIFNLAAVISLILLLATVALWVRGCFVADKVSRGYLWGGPRISFENQPGQMIIEREKSMRGEPIGALGESILELPDSTDAPAWSWDTADRGFIQHFEWNVDQSKFSLLGFKYYSGIAGLSYRMPTRYQAIVLPHWMAALTTSLLPAWWLLTVRGRRARQRRAAGQCVKCGYDLRGSPSGATCPECGAGGTTFPSRQGGSARQT